MKLIAFNCEDGSVIAVNPEFVTGLLANDKTNRLTLYFTGGCKNGFALDAKVHKFADVCFQLFSTTSGT